MKEILIIAIAVVIAVYIYKHNDSSALTSIVIKPTEVELPVSKTLPVKIFECDDRDHCSQMTSCEEATYFLNNYPGARMDGDGDGIACERQFCG